MTAGALDLSAAEAGERRRWFSRSGRIGSVALVVGLIALYLGSRLWFMARLPYFLDEGIFAGYSYQGAQSDHQLFVSLTIGKEPLQAWLGIVWQWLGANPLMSMRLVSMTAGLLTVGVVGLLGCRLGGRTVGIVAAALCVTLPFFVVTDGIGIEEPLITLVMVSALYLQLRLAEDPSLLQGLFLTVVLAVGILTKQTGQAAVILLPFSLVCFDFSAPDRRRRLGRWLGLVAIALVTVLAAEVVLRLSSYWGRGAVLLRSFPLVRTVGQVLSAPFATSAHAWAVFRPALTGYVTLPLIAVGILGAVLAFRAQPRITSLLGVWIVLPFAAALTFTLVPYPRHVMYVLPQALVLIAYAGVWCAARSRRAGRRTVLGLLGVGVTALAMVPALLLDARVLAHPRTVRYPGLDDLQYVTGAPAGGAWPALADAIRRRSGGRRTVILAAEADPNVIRFLLSADPASAANPYSVVLPSDPRFAQSRFAIVDQLPFADQGALRFIAREHFAVAGQFARPRGGAVVTLYERPR